MSKWILTDTQERVLGVNPGSMSGNSGWHSVTGDVPGELFNDNGVALYKRSGNHVVARDAAEIAADTPTPETPPTPDTQRLDEVEAALMELAGIIAGGE